MKKIGLLVTLIILASCGKHGSSESTHPSVDPIMDREETEYVRPQTGLLKMVLLNYKFEHTYEEFSIKSNPNQKVLGHKPFLIFLSEDNSFELNFYNNQDIKKVRYLDLGERFEAVNKKNLDARILQNAQLVTANHLSSTFTYGKPQLNSFDFDILNKVVIVETEAGDLPYVSKMKTMFWVECIGGFKFKNKDEYSCEHGKLKFNYKLLDYELNKVI